MKVGKVAKQAGKHGKMAGMPMPSPSDQPKPKGKLTVRDIIGPGAVAIKQRLFNQVQGKP